MSEQKSEKPTEQRLRNARRDGRVLKSRLLTESLVIAAGWLAGKLILPMVWVRGEKVVNFCFAEGSRNVLFCFNEAVSITFQAVAVTLSLVVLVALLSEGLQVGLRFEFSVLAFKAHRLALSSGFNKVFKSLATAPWYALRLLLTGFIFYLLFENSIGALASSMVLSPRDGLWFVASFKQRLLMLGLAALMLFSLIDYFWQKRRFYQELSMSIDEIRREQRESDGDPGIKAYRRSVAEQLFYSDLVKKIRRSSVVVFKRSESRDS